MRFFDLDLLKDFVFLNIIVGMAIATFAEISFSTLTPFILSDMTFSTIEIATFLSTLSIADIVSRFLSPFVGDYFTISARVMYIFGLLLLVITRMSKFIHHQPKKNNIPDFLAAGVLLCDNFTKLLIVGACLGLAKGIRTVYMILVIPNHVTINKLASASGIRMVANGLVLLCLGPVVGKSEMFRITVFFSYNRRLFIGWIRDFSGSYVICIVFMNCITLTCITMWTIEILYFKFKYKPSKT